MFSCIGCVSHPHLSLQHQQSWRHLPRYIERQLVSSSDYCQGSAFDMFAADWLQSVRPSCRRHCDSVRTKSYRAWSCCKDVDEALRQWTSAELNPFSSLNLFPCSSISRILVPERRMPCRGECVLVRITVSSQLQSSVFCSICWNLLRIHTSSLLWT